MTVIGASVAAGFGWAGAGGAGFLLAGAGSAFLISKGWGFAGGNATAGFNSIGSDFVGADAAGGFFFSDLRVGSSAKASVSSAGSAIGEFDGAANPFRRAAPK